MGHTRESTHVYLQQRNSDKMHLCFHNFKIDRNLSYHSRAETWISPITMGINRIHIAILTYEYIRRCINKKHIYKFTTIGKLTRFCFSVIQITGFLSGSEPKSPIDHDTVCAGLVSAAIRHSMDGVSRLMAAPPSPWFNRYVCCTFVLLVFSSMESLLLSSMESLLLMSFV